MKNGWNATCATSSLKESDLFYSFFLLRLLLVSVNLACSIALDGMLLSYLVSSRNCYVDTLDKLQNPLSYMHYFERYTT